MIALLAGSLLLAGAGPAALASSPEDVAERRATAQAEARAEEQAEERAQEAAEERAEQEAEARAEREAQERAEELAEQRIEGLEAIADAMEERAEAEAERLEDLREAEEEAAKAAAERAEEAREAKEDREEEARERRGSVLARRSAEFEIVLSDVGEPIVKGEIVALVEAGEVAVVEAAGYRVVDREALGALGLVLLRIAVAPADDPEAALAAFAARIDVQSVDFNHIYAMGAPAEELAAVNAPTLDGAARPEAKTAEKAARVGLMDSPVAAAQPCLARALAAQRDFRTVAAPDDPAHGTAVASILAGCGEPSDDFDVALYSASVFFVEDGGASMATAVSLVRALDWLTGQGVQLINMSLAGPPNRLLHRALQNARSRGILLVAAVGNDGPAAPPRYPAAYPEVTGITAVDESMRVYRLAGRGAHVAFAAPGVDVAVAAPAGGTARLSGTSMAAPYAARLMSRLRAAHPDMPAERLTALLAAAAVDLGEEGPDPVYGFGLIRLAGE